MVMREAVRQIQTLVTANVALFASSDVQTTFHCDCMQLLQTAWQSFQ